MAFRSMSRVLTFMQSSPPRLTRLFYLCKCLTHLCYTLVLSFLLFGVSFELNLTSFRSCLKFILHALICFIRFLKPFRMRSGMFFIYPFTRLFKIQSMNQHGSFSSYFHIVVCIIPKEVVQVSERFLLTLRGSWRMIGLFLRRSLIVPHVLPIPTVHWTIIRPPSSPMSNFG